MHQQQTTARAGDEIDLAAMLRILARRKWQMLLVFCLVVAVAIVYLVMAKPVYESRASIYIGEIDRMPLEQTGLLTDRLQSAFGREERAQAGERSWVSKIVANRADKRLIEITVRGADAADAQALAVQVVNEVTAAHDEQLLAHTLPLEKELAQLEQIAEVGRAALAEAGRKRMSLSDSQLTAMMYSVVELGDTHKRIGELRNKLGGVAASATRVGRTPTLPTRPASPRTKLVLALALVAGGLLAAVAAFLAEGLSRLRTGGIDP